MSTPDVIEIKGPSNEMSIREVGSDGSLYRHPVQQKCTSEHVLARNIRKALPFVDNPIMADGEYLVPDVIQVIVSTRVMRVQYLNITVVNGEQVNAAKQPFIIIEPGDDLTGYDPKVVTVAEAVHTVTIVSAWNKVKAQEAAAETARQADRQQALEAAEADFQQTIATEVARQLAL